MKIIVTKNLSFKYIDENNDDDCLILNNLNIDVNRGELVAILGHNGSGKSTLAKHINALLQPTEGEVIVKSMSTKDENNLYEIRKTAGMVFQNPDNQLVATIVEDDVAFGPENLGISPDEIKVRIDKSLELVNMSEFRDKPPHFLSGGQKQRIAIAGILAMQPDIILFDEPTAMLDPIGRKEVIETAIKLNKEHNITILLITHFMEEAALADRVIVMEKGKVIMDETPKKVFSQVEKMKSIGLNVPQVTELSYNLNKLGINIQEDILTVEEMVGAICRLKLKT